MISRIIRATSSVKQVSFKGHSIFNFNDLIKELDAPIASNLILELNIQIPDDFSIINYLRLLAHLDKTELDSAQLELLQSEVKHRPGELTLYAFNDLTFLIYSGTLKLQDEVLDLFLKSFIELSSELNSNNLRNVTRILKIENVTIKNAIFFAELENQVMRFQDQLDLKTFSLILKVFNKHIFLNPSDIHSKLEKKIAELFVDGSASVLCSVLQEFTAAPITYHFVRLAKVMSDKILENPKEYLSIRDGNYFRIAHFYSKFKDYQNINMLFEEYIPEITDEMLQNCSFMGMYMLCIIRKPPSAKYKNYIISQVFKYSNKLDAFRLKKIIISMINDNNALFWDNVKQLGVFWSEKEKLFIKKEYQKLKLHGLIID